MSKLLLETYKEILETSHFTKLENSGLENQEIYQLDPAFGTGTAQIIRFDNPNMLLFRMDIVPVNPLKIFIKLTEEYLGITYMNSNAYVIPSGSKKKQLFAKGSFFIFIHKYAAFICSEKNEPLSFSRLTLTKEYFNNPYLKKADITYERLTENFKIADVHTTHPVFNFIVQQLLTKPTESQSWELFLQSKIIEILITAAESIETNKQKPPIKLDTSDIKGLKKTATYMRNHLNCYPSTEELAALAAMSKSRYMLAFKKYYGITPYVYLQNQRMNRALELLNNSTYSIKDIAQKVGYTKAGHFSKLFKETYGIAPKKYRDMYEIK